MTLLFPLGLLGLIGVPVLIAIYIIKNKYTEQVISSTYLWTLSEKFLKRRNPINKLTGIISLILQILIVVFLSVAIAHPVFILPNAANEYCFILDASGSMNFQTDGKSRLDVGKERISSLIRSSTDGCVYTLVSAGNSVDILYEELDDKERALALLDAVSPAFTANDVDGALGVAQAYFNQNPAVKTYLVTDKTYAETGNVEIVNVAASESNFAVTDVTYTLKGGKLTVEGKAVSYAADALLHVNLQFEGEGEPLTQEVSAKKGEPAEFRFECEKDTFVSMKLYLSERDALKLDDEIVIYNVEHENSYTVLLIGDTPFFIEAALASLKNARIEKLTKTEYETRANGVADKTVSGYDLYIFDSVDPLALPKDGAVWLFNPQTTVPDTGFGVESVRDLPASVRMKYADIENSPSLVERLLSGLSMTDIYVKKYVECGEFYRNFTPLIFCGDYPMVFTGSNAFGNREAVFAFDLHDTHTSISADYALLIRNLIGYTFPDVIEKVSYYCGEVMEINIVGNCDNVRIDTPGGNVVFLDTSRSTGEHTLAEVGLYTITVTKHGDDRPKKYYFYAALPEEERDPSASAQSFVIRGEAGPSTRDGTFDSLVILFILLALLFLADWMVYCYEQYQLR